MLRNKILLNKIINKITNKLSLIRKITSNKIMKIKKCKKINNFKEMNKVVQKFKINQLKT